MLFTSGCFASTHRVVIKTIPQTTTDAVELQRLKVSAKIRADKGPSGRAVITVAAPDLIRVEVYGAMRRLMMVVAGDKDRCRYFKDGAVRDCRWEDGSIDSELGYLPNPEVLVPFLLNASGDSPLSIEVGGGDNLPIKISTSEYLDIGGHLNRGEGLATIPLNIKIESSMDALTIKYRSVELNPQVDGALFEL